MLSAEDNRTLTEVGRGTPMGELLRRYWMPIGAVTELEDTPTKAVRLMGEDLVLYRDRRGTYGLLDRHCAHRSADLSCGIVEECGLRCHYHGWHYDERGRCLAQPYEDTARPGGRFKEHIALTAYPVEAKAGLLWAYLGPAPAPLVPTWEPFTWKNGFVQIVFAEVPCNWLQAQENSIDPIHFEWLHGAWSGALRGLGASARPPRHLKIGFDEFEYGFTYRRVLDGGSEADELWTVGRVCLWPNCLFTGAHFEWRVPIDDGAMLSVGWFFDRVPNEMEPFEQNRIPYWYGPVKDPAGRFITTHVMNQDFVAWTGQGTVTDRTREHLGESDRGVIMMRKRLLDQVAVVASGGEPKGLVRDADLNACVELPIIARARYVNGSPRAELFGEAQTTRGAVLPEGFVFQAGQPEHVRLAYRKAMGLD